MKKKQNKLLLYIIVFETLFLAYLSQVIEGELSLLGRTIGFILYLTPLEMLLHNLSEDETVSNTKRTICKVCFWIFIVFPILGLLLEINDRMGI